MVISVGANPASILITSPITRRIRKNTIREIKSGMKDIRSD